MEIIEKRYKSAIQALSTLETGLKIAQSQKVTTDLELFIALRDSCIQRFEYSIDGFWKFLKLYLEGHEQILFEKTNPRIILLQALQSGLLDPKEFEILIDAIADRNLTSHSYNEQLAEKIVSHIPLYYQTMHAIIIRIKI